MDILIQVVFLLIAVADDCLWGDCGNALEQDKNSPPCAELIIYGIGTRYIIPTAIRLLCPDNIMGQTFPWFTVWGIVPVKVVYGLARNSTIKFCNAGDVRFWYAHRFHNSVHTIAVAEQALMIPACTGVIPVSVQKSDSTFHFEISQRSTEKLVANDTSASLGAIYVIYVI